MTVPMILSASVVSCWRSWRRETGTARLGSVSVPTLVIHGVSDPLIDVSGGRATAQAVAGAELVTIDGMGHDLPRALWPVIATRIAELVGVAEAGPTAVGD
jgi:pimeloyl-ACP methyl ester carboxylesterase